MRLKNGGSDDEVDRIKGLMMDGCEVDKMEVSVNICEFDRMEEWMMDG